MVHYPLSDIESVISEHSQSTVMGYTRLKHEFTDEPNIIFKTISKNRNRKMRTKRAILS